MNYLWEYGEGTKVRPANGLLEQSQRKDRLCSGVSCCQDEFIIVQP